MEISLEDFRRHFELLSDETLLATNREELVASARGVYDEEVARRGLNTSSLAETRAKAPDAAPAAEQEELVLIATYIIPDEANLARGLLQSAGIPFLLQNNYVALGGIELRLLVPAQYEEQALEILQSEISDEELAAQAEAAGAFEEYSEENDDSKPR
ncbi:MAG: DUF2007 domain-containing protein [Acidobacteriota bacterium]|nr:DUF2007 domain-containing protein [Acidobacteriota bacterium]